MSEIINDILKVILIAMCIAFIVCACVYFFQILYSLLEKRIINYNFSIRKCPFKRNVYIINMLMRKPWFDSYRKNKVFFKRNLEHLLLALKPNVRYEFKTHQVIIDKIKKNTKVEFLSITNSKPRNLKKLMKALGAKNYGRSTNHQATLLTRLSKVLSKTDKVQMYKCILVLKTL